MRKRRSLRRFVPTIMLRTMGETNENQTAVVTGASSGIGEATARALRARGWRVYAVARREERLRTLSDETGVIACPMDITDEHAVAALARRVLEAGGVDALVNIAGGARGTDHVADADLPGWEWMYSTNMLGTVAMTKAFIANLRERSGTVLNLTSTAALASYEGGGGYNAAKAAESAMTQALRLEEAEHNVRVIEVLPGMVKTEEFSLRRLGGDSEAAQKVYAGVAEPLTADDVADVVVYALSLPHHVNLDQIVMRPVKQASNYKVIRDAPAPENG